jgi:ABC-2 type transport system ATP-binding protein
MLDEPLTGLDPVGIRRVKRTISARAQAGAAVVLSSHLLQLVEELCTRVLIIQNGQRVALGTVEEIGAGRPELAGRGLEDIFLSLTGYGDREPA